MKIKTVQEKFDKARATIKEASIDYAVETFETKTVELSKLFSSEVIKMLE